MSVRRVRRFEVLYTRQLTQKTKRWQDGVLEYDSASRRALLFDSESGAGGVLASLTVPAGVLADDDAAGDALLQQQQQQPACASLFGAEYEQNGWVRVDALLIDTQRFTVECAVGAGAQQSAASVTAGVAGAAQRPTRAGDAAMMRRRAPVSAANPAVRDLSMHARSALVRTGGSSMRSHVDDDGIGGDARPISSPAVNDVDGDPWRDVLQRAGITGAWQWAVEHRATPRTPADVAEALSAALCDAPPDVACAAVVPPAPLRTLSDVAELLLGALHAGQPEDAYAPAPDLLEYAVPPASDAPAAAPQPQPAVATATSGMFLAAAQFDSASYGGRVLVAQRGSKRRHAGDSDSEGDDGGRSNDTRAAYQAERIERARRLVHSTGSDAQRVRASARDAADFEDGGTAGENLARGSAARQHGAAAPSAPSSGRPVPWTAAPVPNEDAIRRRFASLLVFSLAERDGAPVAARVRHSPVPVSFASATAYCDAFGRAVIEEVNAQLADTAEALRNVLVPLCSAGKVPACAHGPMKLSVVRKPGATCGRSFFGCPLGRGDAKRCNQFVWLDAESVDIRTPVTAVSELVSQARRSGVPLYAGVSASRRSAQAGPRAPGGGSAAMFHLVLNNIEQSSSYSFGDLWVLSATQAFDAGVVFARSDGHGPASSGHLPIVALSPLTERDTMTILSRKLFAVRGPNVFVLLHALGALESMRDATDASGSAQMVAALLGRGRAPSVALSPREPGARAAELAVALATQHKLNVDQQRVMECVAHWVGNDATRQPVPPMLLVHGVFGAGKSFLMAVVIKLLTQASTARILVTGATNAAVDRILCSLLPLEVRFVRVGNRKKIAKQVLPLTVSDSGNDEDSETLRELYALLETRLTRKERTNVMQTITSVKAGRATKRSQLGEAQVVGATVAALCFGALAGQRFDVVIVDEASQMLEPVTLLPLLGFGAAHAILVGDPQQLPPQVCGSDLDEQAAGIGRPLFVRLAALHAPGSPGAPILLRTQYRCHPMLSAPSSHCFYGGRLLDGVSADERAGLVSWLSPVVFIESGGEEAVTAGGSIVNEAEQRLAVHLVRLLTSDAGNVPGEDIGVACLYKSQAAAIEQQLTDDRVRDVRVSTVDAFQGCECEIVVLCCTRTRTLGFSDAAQRLNVAWTRARRHVVVLGCAAVLRSSDYWSAYLERVTSVLHRDAVLGMSIPARRADKS